MHGHSAGSLYGQTNTAPQYQPWNTSTRTAQHCHQFHALRLPYQLFATYPREFTLVCSEDLVEQSTCSQANAALDAQNDILRMTSKHDTPDEDAHPESTPPRLHLAHVPVCFPLATPPWVMITFLDGAAVAAE